MAGPLKVQLEGSELMLVRLRYLAANFPLEARRGANVVIKDLLEKTKKRVPVKTGALKDSGRTVVSMSKVGGAPNIAASIVYGNSQVRYARIVHEDLKRKHPNGGGPKFVESVILEAQPTMGARLADEIAIKRAMKK